MMCVWLFRGYRYGLCIRAKKSLEKAMKDVAENLQSYFSKSDISDQNEKVKSKKNQSIKRARKKKSE